MEETTNTCEWYDPSCALGWLRDEFQAFGVWIWDSILSGIASVFEAIPVPEFMLNVDSYTLPTSVSWAASAFQLDVGLGIIVSAYISRFILRRIPIIG
ncbi:MAG: hypothetical protein CMI06_07980 [Oceanospirillaceae bacterium]|nr:hypothetical protein [Oceanospirillaceae bacterium]|tara:strand:+ start:1755 stop:2048 length:294 start_codon:yes stop_codon:yes gene_type:complete